MTDVWNGLHLFHLSRAARPVTLTVALVLTLAAAFSARSPSRVLAAGNSVSITQSAFSALPTVIAVGDTVTWTNNDADFHTVTPDGGGWDSGIILEGKSFSHTFTAAGTYRYVCILHLFMKGTVVVEQP